MNLIELNSVGCVIDENGVTYPMLVDGLGIDGDGACHINDITNDEFFDALSTEDCDVVNEYLNRTHPLEFEREARLSVEKWNALLERQDLEMRAELAYGI